MLMLKRLKEIWNSPWQGLIAFLLLIAIGVALGELARACK